MKSLDISQAEIATCISDAQNEPIVVTKSGAPIALIVGIAGLDEEQVELSASDDFWRMIQERRQQAVLSRADLEKRLGP